MRNKDEILGNLGCMGAQIDRLMIMVPPFCDEIMKHIVEDFNKVVKLIEENEE